MSTVCKYCRPKKTFANGADLLTHLTEHKYKCNKCYIELGSWYTWANHYDKKHTNQCLYCNAVVGEDRAAKINHIQEKHKFFACTICLTCFASNDGLKAHYKNPQGNHPFRCKKCDKELMNNLDFWMHCFEMHKTQCPLCESALKQTFNEKLEWDVHLKTVHQLHPCVDCHEVFRNKHECEEHFNNQHRFECEFCPKTFPYETQLEEHVNAHRVKCTLCEQYYYSKEMMEAHMQSKHRFPCAICGMVLDTEVNRDLHATVMHQVQCEVCSLRLDSQSVQRAHYNTVHQLHCDFCTKIFVTVEELQLHCINKHDKSYKQDSGLWIGLDDTSSLMDDQLNCSACDEMMPSEIELVKHYIEGHVDD